MAKKLKLSTFRYGDPPKRGEGLRIGTTRRPPRGVLRRYWQSEGFFDVWFPMVAPSIALLARVKKRGMDGRAKFRAFCASYERELMGNAESRQALELLAALAKRTPISVGCFCEDEDWCHRSHLRKLIERMARG